MPHPVTSNFNGQQVDGLRALAAYLSCSAADFFSLLIAFAFGRSTRSSRNSGDPLVRRCRGGGIAHLIYRLR
jgi:hypothetical protein